MEEDKEVLKSDEQQMSDIVAETGQLLPAFKMAYKKGNLDLFREFIHKHKLQEEFVQNSFNDSLKLRGDEYKCFSKMVKEEGIEYLSRIYGKEFGKKLNEFNKNGKINLMDIYQISVMDRDEHPEKQANIMIKILELYENDDLEIGIHRTGGAVSGETLNKEGLNLTGDLSSGVKNDYGPNIMDCLEKNITFDNSCGMLLTCIANGGTYKNYMGKKFVDIQIVAIPKSELEKNNEKELIIKSSGVSGEHDRLNPKFIRGYVTVDSQSDMMKQYVENPIYFLKDKNIPSNILKQTIEDSKIKVGLSKITQLIEKIKQRIKSKDKNKEGIKEDDGNR